MEELLSTGSIPDAGGMIAAERDYAGAIADYTKSIEILPRYALAYYNRGNARLAQGDLASAISDYDSAIAMSSGLPKPRLPDVYNNRGHAWLERGDFEKAIADSNEAIKINPRYALGYLNRGLSRLAQGREDEAERDFHRCIELDDSLRHSVAESSRQVMQRRRANELLKAAQALSLVPR